LRKSDSKPGKSDSRLENSVERQFLREWRVSTARKTKRTDFIIQGQLRHADYIGAWIKLLEDHDTAFYSAAQQAQAAVDYIRARIIADDVARDAA